MVATQTLGPGTHVRVLTGPSQGTLMIIVRVLMRETYYVAPHPDGRDGIYLERNQFEVSGSQTRRSDVPPV